MSERKKLTAFLVAAFILLAAGCDSGAETPAQTPEAVPPRYRVFLATDLHYLAPSLTDHGPLFWQVMEAGDGKVTEYCDEATDAFLEEAAEAKPDAVILTGDLSFNGERESHLVLAEKLAAAEEAGIPVFVLPGNHDLYRKCYSFFGETSQRVDTVSAEEFREIYSAFGFDEATAQDSDSLSYMAQLNSGTRLLMLDANTTHDFCSLSEKTLAWTERQLKAAQEAGQSVLACCHQNLLRHSMFGSGYVLGCSEKLQALLEEYGVPLMLSGHLHIQHVMTVGKVTEIATSPLTMGACQYGIICAENGSLSYETKKVPVSDWAERKKLSDENLLHFESYALERLAARTRRQAEAQLKQLSFPPEEIPALAEYASALNTGYFTGNLTALPALDPAGSLLGKWRDSRTSFGSYFASIKDEIGLDHTRWQLETP